MRIALFLALGSMQLFGAQQIITTTYSVSTPNSEPEGITIGPDSNVWFTENLTGKIGRLVPATGVVTEFSTPDGPGSVPWDIISGPDGALWYTDTSNSYIGRLTTNGVFTNLYPTLTPDAGPRRLTIGSDGAFWFTEYLVAKIARMTLNGEMTEYVVPTPNSEPSGITSGPDGAIWFNENAGNQIVRVTTDGVFTNAYPLPTPDSILGQIHTGPDGNLWVTENASNKVGRLNPTTGVLTEWDMPTRQSVPGGLTAAADGAMWVTEWAETANQIARITPDGLITEYPDGSPDSQPWGITANGTSLYYADWTTDAIGTAPICALGLTASYTSETSKLDLGFSIGTSEAWTWTTWVREASGTVKPLWSKPLAAQLPLEVHSIEVPFASTGGDITVVSGLFNSTGAMVCEEKEPVNTGAVVTSTTMLTTSPNPSNAGQTVTLTATVSPSTATGSVSFYSGSTALVLAIPLVNGVASVPTAALPKGANYLTATYSGDVNDTASTSRFVKQEVN
jgi:virginiamycin B lyase